MSKSQQRLHSLYYDPAPAVVVVVPEHAYTGWRPCLTHGAFFFTLGATAGAVVGGAYGRSVPGSAVQLGSVLGVQRVVECSLNQRPELTRSFALQYPFAHNDWRRVAATHHIISFMAAGFIMPLGEQLTKKKAADRLPVGKLMTTCVKRSLGLGALSVVLNMLISE